MQDIDNIFESIYRQGLNDADVIGLFLSGSRGKNFQGAYSDYDIRLVFRNGIDLDKVSQAYKQFEKSQVIEFAFMTLQQLKNYAEFGTEFVWDRYSFSHVKALIDKTGELQAILESKGNLPESIRHDFIRAHLDGFINAVYRSLKCHRRANLLGAKLESITGIPDFLSVIFALEGRHAPFLGYLEKELTTYPLLRFPLDTQKLLSLLDQIVDLASVSAQQELMQTIEPLCKDEGMVDVFEAWGDAYPWLLSFKLA